MPENEVENWQKVLCLERQGTPMERYFSHSGYKTMCCVPRFSKEYKGVLKNFCITIHNIYPNLQTYNPYRRLAQQTKLPDHLPIETYLELFDELVHALTSINHLYRVKTKEGYESIREDNMMALQMLSPEIFPDKFISKAHKSTYNALHKIYGTKTGFKIGEAHRRLRMARRTLQKHIKHLESVKLVKVTKKDHYRGNCYRLNPIL
ncbi:MAG: hypothetical protein GY705_12940 [Bacteroidetes bacterium]|nr:hypothetical protein [Bacteroidota bacterium]